MTLHTPPARLTVCSVALQAHVHPVVPEVLPEVSLPASGRPDGVRRDHLQHLRQETEHGRAGRGGAGEETEVTPVVRSRAGQLGGLASPWAGAPRGCAAPAGTAAGHQPGAWRVTRASREGSCRCPVAASFSPVCLTESYGITVWGTFRSVLHIGTCPWGHDAGPCCVRALPCPTPRPPALRKEQASPVKAPRPDRLKFMSSFH